MSTLVGIIAVFLLVFINGFFVAAEFALVGARRTRIAQLAEEGHPSAKVVQGAFEHLDSYIAATQLGITLASLGLGWIGEPAIAHVFEPLFERFLPADVLDAAGSTISIAIAFSLVTVLHIVLGELVPKSIALQRPESTALVVVSPTTLFLRLFRPVIWIMNGIGNRLVRMLGFEPASGHAQVHSAEELEMLVQSSREAGVLQASEELLLRRVFDFGEVHVEEVMHPRMDMHALPVGIGPLDLLAFMRTYHHSRYPVYEETLDKVIGVLHIKDLFDLLSDRPDLLQAEQIDLHPLLRKPLFVPGTLTVDKLLERMQKTKTHIAIVIEEYGGVAGMTTMEDILEELVGEVHDEFDQEDNPVVTKGNITVVDGLLGVHEAIGRFGDPGFEPESTTVGGYISERLSRIAVEGDK
ncbi:MAG: HlyC/CorC family transporter, partial [Anaerolineae bacterium]|nr:HlyC/CorC family transporter [Anaerolineae bacterium]